MPSFQGFSALIPSIMCKFHYSLDVVFVEQHPATGFGITIDSES